MINKVRGFNDIWGKDADVINYIKNIFYEVSKNFDIIPLFLPIVENENIFTNNIGEYSDIVNKEMYKISDRKNRKLALRPEGTVGTMRFVVEEKLLTKQNDVLKFFYIGEMFRYERPQSGRSRQFIQYGVEYININSIYYIVEVIQLANSILKILKIENIILEINTLGNSLSILNYSKDLKLYFSPHLNKLCDVCKKRFSNNVLRILDCKTDQHTNKKIYSNIPDNTKFLSKEDIKIFEKIQTLLKISNIPYKINKSLVRGLDYYSGIVYEFISEDDGKTIIAGGNYNDVSKKIGFNNSVPSTGFAAGIERIATLFKKYNSNISFRVNKKIYIANIDDETKNYSLICSYYIRLLGQDVTINYEKNINLKKLLKKISDQNYDYLIIIDIENSKKNNISIKNLHTRKQQIISLDALKGYFGE